ncbi:type I-A CRISPR-associated protein Cas4/Csa1 [Vulcanisaeta distributa]|uniref:CRISPR-associated protein, Csa1 family n=1 Tax=Vulcanisaeta distributa (strain DSM 14429 / JCM 11212 / NBRC 100878 / IC-017) TaxID=572478 RepID=E1QU80_VULDI|nr:type I-A CRISPR-associated protein Cas4/Csa1 [Vulcanisaeta distributa]ADN51074.1 CRISPR-associated protein, Csa1 family [Vulcanisaeta distributa DSM 14429]
MVLPRWVWDYIKVTMEGGSYAEIRGWFRDAVAPRHVVRPTVSEVSSPCPTKRDAYLRRVAGVTMEDSESLRLGRMVHEVFLTPFKESIPFSQLDNRFESIINEYGDLGNKYRAQLYEVYTKAVATSLNAREEGIPISVEPAIPGAPIGLSDIVKPDILVGFIPVELVTSSQPTEELTSRKDIAVTAYALAIEAWIGHPVDIGVVLHISINGKPRLTWRVVKIDDTLRRAFLDMRDNVARIIEHGDDPGPASSCPRTCPFYGVCHG